MKKLILTVCMLCIMSAIFAQGRKFKDERRVYLWDVTLSMKGYNGAPDIYDQVVKDLTTDINNIEDDHTELIVLPFQEGILETWKEKATPAGKKALIGKIKNYSNERITRTNLCTPLKDVMNKYLTPDKRNVLYLFTDGAHNMKSPSVEDYHALLNSWCNFAEKNDVYGFYMMLTKNAEDPKLINIIETVCNFDVVKGVGHEFLLLRPEESKISYNIKDNAGKPITITIASNINKNYPAGVKLHVWCNDNNYVKIDQTISLSHDGKIDIKVTQKMNYESMKNSMPQTMRIPIHLELKDSGNGNTLTKLIANRVNLELINKPEKTLKVYVKPEKK